MLVTRVLLIGLATGTLLVSGCTTFRKGAVLASTTAAGAGIGAAVSGGNPLATAGGGAAGLLAGVGVNAVADAQEHHQQVVAEEQAEAQRAHEAYFKQEDAQGPGAEGGAAAGTQHYYDVVLPPQTDSYGVLRTPAHVKIPVVE
jgi:hypothetical protein